MAMTLVMRLASRATAPVRHLGMGWQAGRVSISARTRMCSSLVSTEPEKKEAPVQTIPGVHRGGDKLTMMFTCTVCDTRSAKIISKVGAPQQWRCARLAFAPRPHHRLRTHLGWYWHSAQGARTII